MGAFAKGIKAAVKRIGDEASLGGKLRAPTAAEELQARRAIQPKKVENKGDDIPSWARGPLGGALNRAWELDEKKTNAYLKKMGFINPDDPKSGRGGPAAVASALDWYGIPSIAAIASSLVGSPGSWEEQAALHERRLQLTKWLLDQPSNREKDDPTGEKVAATRRRWEENFPEAKEAFRQLGKEWFSTRKKEADLLRDGILGVDRLLADIQANPPPKPQQAASQQPPSPPTGELIPGTPEWEQEKQRRLQQWRELKKDTLGGPRSDLGITPDGAPSANPLTIT